MWDVVSETDLRHSVQEGFCPFNRGPRLAHDDYVEDGRRPLHHAAVAALHHQHGVHEEPPKRPGGSGAVLGADFIMGSP